MSATGIRSQRRAVPDPWRDDLADTQVLLRPVFVDEGNRRRRLLTRAGWLAAASCLVYLAMLGFVLVAVPIGRLPVDTPRAATTRPVHRAQADRARIVAPGLLRPVRPPARIADLRALGVVVAHRVTALPVPARPVAIPPPAVAAHTQRPVANHRARTGHDATRTTTTPQPAALPTATTRP